MPARRPWKEVLPEEDPEGVDDGWPDADEEDAEKAHQQLHYYCWELNGGEGIYRSKSTNQEKLIAFYNACVVRSFGPKDLCVYVVYLVLKFRLAMADLIL